MIDDEELSEHYSGLCRRRATAMSMRACHVGHGLRLVSAVGMLYNAGHVPWTHTHETLLVDICYRPLRIGWAIRR